MSEVTLEAIDQLLERKFEEKLEPINTKLSAIEDIVSGHTTQLNNLSKDVKTLLENKTVTNYRLSRLEEWGVKAGKKIEVKLEV